MSEERTVSARVVLAAGVVLCAGGLIGPVWCIAGRERAAPVVEPAADDGPLRPEMVWLPTGAFTMGSPPGEEGRRAEREGPVEVRLNYRFAISRTEVTQGQWRAVMGGNPSWFQGVKVAAAGDDPDLLPVERVSWAAALVYCNRLSEREGLEPCFDLAGCAGDPNDGGTERFEDLDNPQGYACEQVKLTRPECDGYRLPTESEWEYATRAGTQSRYWSGDAVDDRARVGWYHQNSERRTHPVGAKGSAGQNPWGLSDVHGNVWEWTLDPYATELQSQTFERAGVALQSSFSPSASGASRRVGRGCGWSSYAANCRAASRNRDHPARRNADQGFRVARTRPSALEPSVPRPSP